MTGEPLSDVYQDGGEQAASTGFLYATYRANESGEGIAKECSQQLYRMGQRGLACRLVADYDYGGDDMPIYAEWLKLAERAGVDNPGDIMIGPGRLWGEPTAAGLRVLAESGSTDWSEIRVQDVPVGNSVDDSLGSMCFGP